MNAESWTPQPGAVVFRTEWDLAIDEGETTDPDALREDLAYVVVRRRDGSTACVHLSRADYYRDLVAKDAHDREYSRTEMARLVAFSPADFAPTFGEALRRWLAVEIAYHGRHLDEAKRLLQVADVIERPGGRT